MYSPSKITDTTRIQLGTGIVGVGDVGLEVDDETVFLKRAAYGNEAPYTACTQYESV